MSDDPFNDPYRRPAPSQRAAYGEEEDQTQMVDLNELNEGGPAPQFAPPPTFDPGEATQLFEIPPSMSGGPDDDDITSSVPDFSSSAYNYGAPPAPSRPQPPHPSQSSGFGSGPVSGGGAGFGSGPVSGGGAAFGSGPVSGGGAAFGSGPVSGGSNQDQIYVGGSDAGYEGHTQFVNISDFAQEKAYFTPEQQQAGYDGNTQFVDINALMAGSQLGGGDSIDNDDELKRGYQFSPEDVTRGDVTIIRASNPLGKAVILKQVWEGDPSSMSTPLRQRIAQLHELKHPALLPMNGLFVSRSGMWAELDAPQGQQLTTLLQTQGPQPADKVLAWTKSIAEVLTTIHQQHLAYANLTTDSIWISPAGEVQIEPFDMLRLMDRGNLGAFGPPEMNAPPEQRQLSPATDVYSLAATTAAALTGLPFQPQKLDELQDKKLAAKLQSALNPNPAERPGSALDFANSLSGKGLDIKFVGAAAAGILLLMTLMLVMTGDGKKQQQSAPPQQSAPVAMDTESPGLGSPLGANAAPAPAVNLPGPVTQDPRLHIQNSFAQNPPVVAATKASDEELEEWRQTAREHEEKGDAASRANRAEHYSKALELRARIIRSQSAAPPEDWEHWHSLFAKDELTSNLARPREQIEKMLESGNLAQSRRHFTDLARLDPRINTDTFVSSNNTAKLVDIEPRRLDAEQEN